MLVRSLDSIANAPSSTIFTCSPIRKASSGHAETASKTDCWILCRCRTNTACPSSRRYGATTVGPLSCQVTLSKRTHPKLYTSASALAKICPSRDLGGQHTERCLRLAYHSLSSTKPEGRNMPGKRGGRLSHEPSSMLLGTNMHPSNGILEQSLWTSPFCPLWGASWM